MLRVLRWEKSLKDALGAVGARLTPEEKSVLDQATAWKVEGD